MYDSSNPLQQLPPGNHDTWIGSLYILRKLRDQNLLLVAKVGPLDRLCLLNSYIDTLICEYEKLLGEESNDQAKHG